MKENKSAVVWEGDVNLTRCRIVAQNGGERVRLGVEVECTDLMGQSAWTDIGIEDEFICDAMQEAVRSFGEKALEY